MKTSMDLFDALLGHLRKMAQRGDMAFRQKGDAGALAHPAVYPFTLPPKNQGAGADEPLPYIVLKYQGEEQAMLQAPEECKLTFLVFLGVYRPDRDWALGLRDLVAGLERLEVLLKNVHLLAGIGELGSIKKTVPDEQPYPYFEGTIELVYTYYKPVLLPEP
jgi:hypothetical protein